MNENNVLYLEELGINEKEVKNSEEQGVNVVILDEEGRVLYKTSTCDNEEFCGMCPYLRLIPECEADANHWKNT